MNKKVRYALGLAGVVPALGMLQPVAAHAAAHTAKESVPASKKTVRTVALGHLEGGTLSPLATTCIASREHTSNYPLTDGTIHLKYWSKPEGSRTCIGTIEVSGVPNYSSPVIQTGVLNVNGSFCVRSTHGTHSTNVCRRIFVRTDLEVAVRVYTNMGLIASFYNIP
jgi:hypothetical protein